MDMGQEFNREWANQSLVFIWKIVKYVLAHMKVQTRLVPNIQCTRVLALGFCFEYTFALTGV